MSNKPDFEIGGHVFKHHDVSGTWTCRGCGFIWKTTLDPIEVVAKEAWLGGRLEACKGLTGANDMRDRYERFKCDHCFQIKEVPDGPLVSMPPDGWVSVNIHKSDDYEPKHFCGFRCAIDGLKTWKADKFRQAHPIVEGDNHGNG